MLLRTIRYSVKKLKVVEAESWIVKPEDAHVKFSMDKIEHLNVKYYRNIKK